MKQAIESSDIKALRKVLSEININISAIRSNAKNFVSNAIVAGQLLAKIKEATKYGDWRGFLESVELTHNTAARYMRLWEHRTAIDLKTVKSLSDAEAMIAQLCDSVSEFQGIETPTSQNEPLTHEQTSDSETQKRSGLGTDSGHTGTARREAKEADPKARPSAFDVDEIPRDNSRAYLSGPAKPEKNGAPKPDVRLDKEGRKIPDDVLPLWDKSLALATHLRSIISEVKCTLENGIEKDDIFGELANPIISDLRSVHYTLSHLIPYALCHKCSGVNWKQCPVCHHRGFYSKLYWDGPTVGEAMRTVIRNGVKSHASQTLSA